MVLAAVALGGGILVTLIIAVIVAVVIYAVGVYVLHAPVQIVGILAFLVFLALLFGGVR